MNKIQLWLLAQLNIPYRIGGDDPMSGYDCSGLAQEYLLSFGWWPFGKSDANAQQIFSFFSSKYGQSPRGVVGDLVFYGQSPAQVRHVGILFDEDSMVSEAGGDFGTKTLNDAVEKNAFSKMRPIHYRPDFIAVVGGFH